MVERKEKRKVQFSSVCSRTVLPTAMVIRRSSQNFDEISNTDYASDIKYALQQTRWILRMIGIWPRANPTRWQRLISNLTLPICPIAAVIILIPLISHTVVVEGQILILFGAIEYQTGTLLKSLILISRRDDIKIIVEHIDANWRTLQMPKDREIMLRNLKLGRDITTFCFVGLYGTSFMYCTVPYFMPAYLNEFNQSVRQLIFPGFDIFVDMQVGYNYEIVYFASFLYAFIFSFINMAIYNLALICVTNACAQIQIIMSRLETLVGSAEDVVTVEARIQFIIRTHVRVLRFSANTEEFLREICAVEVVTITLLICWVEYWFLMEWEDKNIMGLMQYFLLFMSYAANFFIFCHIGELLKEECEKVGKAAYMIEWYRLPGKTGLSLILMMTIANYPCKLTAGRMLDLTYYSFGSVIKTTIAYLNMMRAMMA